VSRAPHVPIIPAAYVANVLTATLRADVSGQVSLLSTCRTGCGTVAARATTVAPTTFSESVQGDDRPGGYLSDAAVTGTGIERCIFTLSRCSAGVYKARPAPRIAVSWTVATPRLRCRASAFRSARSPLFDREEPENVLPACRVYHGKLTIERDPQTGRNSSCDTIGAADDIRKIGRSSPRRGRGALEVRGKPLSVDEFARQINRTREAYPMADYLRNNGCPRYGMCRLASSGFLRRAVQGYVFSFTNANGRWRDSFSLLLGPPQGCCRTAYFMD